MPDSTEYTILARRVPELEKRVKRLNKKGGNIVLTVLRERVERLEAVPEADLPVRNRYVADVALQGLAVIVSGWTFLAALEWINGAQIVTHAPGIDIPREYWDREPECEHCGFERKRIYTYVLRSESGKYKQVGKTCLKDFLGSTDPGLAVNVFALMSDLADWGGEEDEEGGCSSGRLVGYDALTLLAVTSAMIRENGWISRGKCPMGELSTSEQALDVLAKNPCPELTAGDVEKARSTLAWVESLEAKSDYEHNLKTVLTGQEDCFVRSKHAGLACSAVAGYDREQNRQAAQAAQVPSTHFGEVGKRYKGLTCTVTRVSYCSGMYGESTILGLVTAEGCQLVWFASNGISGCQDEDALRGKQIVIDGTVKDHSTFRGTPQTKLTRCKLKSVVD